MDHIKEAFEKVKQDMNSLKQEIDFLRLSLNETREKMIEICEIMGKMNKKLEKAPSTHKPQIQTVSTYPSTHKQPLEALNPQNISISTGNHGVSTDRQTDTSTDRQTQNKAKNEQNSIENVSEILNSLDDIKKEIRLKFKRLTEQELLVFSTIYQLDEEIGYTDYKTISQRLNLTESSVRDYVGRLIKKGIPVDKKRINNKIIHLSISQNLRKIATLSTILQLRDI